jgi:hypothetical protein
MVAGGVATAVAMPSPSAPAGPPLQVDQAVIRAENLMPTSSHNPDPKQVAVGVLPLSAERPQHLVAECTNCAPGSPEAEQFDALVIEVRSPGSPGGKVYRGPLDQLDAVVKAENNKDVTVRVWLADTGKPQPQGVTSEWSFTASEDPGAPLGPG